MRLWRAMRTRNACKTCALGMGGQRGGMTNEVGHFPEVCKKSFQAMVADMQGEIRPEFFSRYSVGELRGMSSQELEACGRLAQPMVLRPGAQHFEPVSWDDAIDDVARRLAGTDPRRKFFYASGRSSNEAGFVLHLLARSLGTNHVSNCSYYCHQASGVGLNDSIGTGTATVSLEDLETCDLVFLIGGNPASNHPRLMTSLAKLRRRGGQVVVVNPIREVGLTEFRIPSSVRSMLCGSKIASLYLQPMIGGDIALLAAIAKCIVTMQAVDKGFVANHTEGFEELVTFIEEQELSDLSARCGVPIEEIQAAARIYAHSDQAIFAWTMGITHHVHGVENVQWIVNLALLRGMLGKPGAGLMPIRGHSNVQGMGTVGVSPAMSREAIERLSVLGLPPPDFVGYDTIGALEAAERGEMDVALCLGGNLFGASPDASFATTALSKVDCVAYLSTTLNTGHAHGTGGTTYLLPVRARDEEAEPTTQESMFSYVRLSDGGPNRLASARGEVDILCALGERAIEGGPIDWALLRKHDAVRRLIARLVPGLESMETIGATRQEFQIPGRILHEPKFATPSGRAAFRVHPVPSQPERGPSQLLLTTVRSEGQFNTVVYEEADLYRGQDRRDVILLNPDDLLRLGLLENQLVDVQSEVGVMRGVLARSFDIAVGCAAMYYPEANALVARTVDPRSRTPAFKATVVEVCPSQESGTIPREAILSARRRDDLKSC